ncbi:hypothetical protein EAI_16752 [Harpegnathos saltator]|uniref:C2H2-type domain-containing protein n=2 Tax=Harpegnathos saltator TaxID=610380 RepID=E2B7X7_HARSA|nr:hypothetical protein EAI_16752 [Harpegnathos saltator]
MDMTDLDEVFGLNNYKWSNYNYQSSDLEDVLSEQRCLLPNEQEGSNVMQPGPSLENNLCGKHSIKESSTKKYIKFQKQCHICKQNFNDKHELNDHYEKDHKYHFYKCKYCNYKTNRRGNLERHEEIHLRIYSTKSSDYVCIEPGCNSRYKDKYDFKYHIKICQ